jgi:hypothetical protein
VIARLRRVEPAALPLAQALAVLGDGCELRHGAAMAGLQMTDAARLATALVRSCPRSPGDRCHSCGSIGRSFNKLATKRRRKPVSGSSR